MVLMLSVLRCPDAAMPGTRRVSGGDFTLGRAEGCDWVLADPDRVLSKRHCTLEFRSGGWQVRDLSTNGTFVNGSAQPVGRDSSAPLNDGDRLRLGAYEIEVRMEEEAASPWSQPAAPGGFQGGFQGGPAFPPSSSVLDDPFAGISPPPPAPPASGFSEGIGLPPLGDPRAPAGSAPGFGSSPASPFATPPVNFDPLSPPGAGGFGASPPATTWPDHTPDSSSAFVPPRAHFGGDLPVDWNRPLSAPPASPAGEPDWDKLLGDFSPPPAAAPFGASHPAVPALPPDPFTPAPPPGPAPFTPATPPVARDSFASPTAPAEASPFTPAANPFAEPAVQARDPFAAAAPPAPPAWPAQDSSPSPFDESAAPPAFTAPVAAPLPVAPPPAPVAQGDAHAALAALLRGAGLPPLPPGTDPIAALEAAGAALRAAIGGMRGLLIARADVKRAFRIEQTMLSRRDNNPVKFAPTDEASIATLLTAGGGRGPAAVQETVSDLTLHQVATLAATQAAARSLLERLAPSEVEASSPGGSGLLPGAREKRLWEAYRGLHSKLLEQFEDDFDSAFGRAFARAYENAAREAGRPQQ
ncbi:type VI secretion system-associated FHA domain protein TagH [Roseomonas chloroacetimidivorans]|uniref:type VI secretion system-associated FHA domain protein TagH n=1 Tax=Roseomonas chloroacetimidivorans TaxID=1766656 RepID=UPI003C77DCDE